MAETFESTFGAIYDEAFDIMVERQRKYGPDNVRQLGFFGVFSRLAFDKVERVKRSLNGELVHGEVLLEQAADFGDESLDDALVDILNYAAILIALRRGVWGRPLAEDDPDSARPLDRLRDWCWPQDDGCECAMIAGHQIGSEGCVHERP